MSTNDEAARRVSRRTLLQGAGLFGGLGAWHAAVAASGAVASAALISVPGKAMAEITGCIVGFTQDGTGHSCSPVYEDCTANAGTTMCTTQVGGTVACTGDTCLTMIGDYTCSTAVCAGAMTGDCTNLGGCHDLAGDCTRLQDCDSLAGDCNRLSNCDSQAGTCNRQQSCTDHQGGCEAQGSCSCHVAGSQSGEGSLVRSGIEISESNRSRMPFARSLATSGEWEP